jgi:hypothetical protein
MPRQIQVLTLLFYYLPQCALAYADACCIQVLTRLFYYLPQCALAANVIVAALGLVDLHEPGSQFTCFTSTKVQILAANVIVAALGLVDLHEPGSHFTCFTSTKVQILTPRARGLARTSLPLQGLDRALIES